MYVTAMYNHPQNEYKHVSVMLTAVYICYNVVRHNTSVYNTKCINFVLLLFCSVHVRNLPGKVYG